MNQAPIIYLVSSLQKECAKSWQSSANSCSHVLLMVTGLVNWTGFYFYSKYSNKTIVLDAQNTYYAYLLQFKGYLIKVSQFIHNQIFYCTSYPLPWYYNILLSNIEGILFGSS